jgi:hypothetical protein
LFLRKTLELSNLIRKTRKLISSLVIIFVRNKYYWKKMKRQIVLLVTCIFILAACGPKTAATEIPTSSAATLEQPTATVTENPSSTPEPVPSATPEPSATATATLDPLKVTYKSVSTDWPTNSAISFELSQNTGDYYAYVSRAGGYSQSYSCRFAVADPYELNCQGGKFSFKGAVYVELHEKTTSEVLFTQTIQFASIVPTPTGMACEIEPQWNGATADHQKETGCFAASCWQNGVFFYGSDYVCEGQWPFEWDMPHPLYTPESN